MKLAIISFARKGSKRLPGKNMKLLNKRPLLSYTLFLMWELKNYNFIFNNEVITFIPYCFYDDVDMQELIFSYYINPIWRDHPKEWDDNRLNQWAHEICNADAYLLLQPTSPFRDKDKIIEWLKICIISKIQSAFAVTKQDDLIFKRNGLFFYYTKEQLETGKLVDENSLIFQGFDIDIDTIEDFRKAEEYAKQNYS